MLLRLQAHCWRACALFIYIYTIEIDYSLTESVTEINALDYSKSSSNMRHR